jgi:two-component system response regulator PhoP
MMKAWYLGTLPLAANFNSSDGLKSKMRVLIIEDEIKLARNIAKALNEAASFAADISTDGEDGQHMALTNPYDMIILDLMLPKIDGMQILQNLRLKGHHTPVLILTAKGTTEDIIKGLDMGSDDYLTKPFEMAELLARCRALTRRAYDSPNPVIKVGDLSINMATHAVIFEGKRFFLPAMEYRLLEYLALRAGRLVSKAEIIEHLYEFNSENFSNVVEVYVSNLRKQFDPGPRRTLIHTVRGQGYIIGDIPQ